MKIGVVIAMEKEFLRVRDLITDYSTITINNKPFTTGKLGNNTIVMATSGIGKVNAAMCSLEMINAFHPDVMVSTGVAGGADVSLEVQQVVVAEQTCYHDVYCGSEVEYGQVIGQPSRFECAERLVSKALALKCGTTVRKGLIVTGDLFVDDREKMRSIISHFPDAMAVDMESAAIAHVCHTEGVPFVSFRIISDIPLKDDKAQMYFDFWEKIADNSFNVTKSFLESIEG